MKKKDVIISIHGSHFSGPDDDEPGDAALVTSGFLTSMDGGYVLSYQENQADGPGGTSTTLLVQGKRVTLLRSGDVSTQMIFEQGHRHLSFYNTEEGPLTIGVKASRVRAEMSEQGGDIEMEYNIEIDSSMAAESRVKINVRASDEPFSSRSERGIYYSPYVN